MTDDLDPNKDADVHVLDAELHLKLVHCPRLCHYLSLLLLIGESTPISMKLESARAYYPSRPTLRPTSFQMTESTLYLLSV